MKDEDKNQQSWGCQVMVNDGGYNEPLAWYVQRRSRAAARRALKTLGHRGHHGQAEDKTADPAVERTAKELYMDIKAGDRVRVKLREEIESTLDHDGKLKGCGFLKPMGEFCGRELTVAKRLERFFDERQWKMLKCKNIVLLEEARCDGSGHPDTQGCDRMCLFFWRTEWLERIS